MPRRFGPLVVLAIAWALPSASRAEAGLGPFVLGARFEYALRVGAGADLYPWGADSHTASDRSRFMVDAKALDTRYGSVYVKGAALWTALGEDDLRRRVRFEQGDYLWGQSLDGWNYRLRLFANERRFFVHDWTTPLVGDERAGATGENRGVRADVAFEEAVRVTGLFSVLGGSWDDSRRASYVKAFFVHRVAALSASYLAEDPRESGLRHRAAVKAEITSAVRNVFAAVSYRQAGWSEKAFFFPKGSFDWSAWEATRFAAVLPPSGAASAELRVSSLSLGRAAEADIVWRYDAVGEEFADDLGSADPSGIAQNLGAYFAAKDASVNGRVTYRTLVRSGVENEEGRSLEGGLWAALQNGMECFVRSGIGEVRDDVGNEKETGFVHAAVRYRTKRMHSGAHAAWTEEKTGHSTPSFAWEGKLALNPAWSFHWRLLVRDEDAVGQSASFRVEYRPSDRVVAYVGYGEPSLGDEPFVLEGLDVGLVRAVPREYRCGVRADF